MFAFTREPTNQINSKYYPICSMGRPFGGKQNNLIYICNMDYNCYIKKVENLLSRWVDDAGDREYLINFIHERQLPKGKYKKLVGDMISSLDEAFGRNMSFSNKKIILMKYPNPLSRDAITIYGQNGSGKSYWASQYIKLYKKNYPDQSIYLITTNVDDESVYKGMSVKKLDVSDRDKLDSYKFDETTFADSLVIFDDIEHYDVGIYTWIRNLRDILFLKARKHNVDILNIVHKGLDSYNTRIPNNEQTGGVFFPRHNVQEAKKILSSYFDLNTKQINQVLGSETKRESRWVYVNKIYPKYMITEKRVILLD